MSDLMSTYLPHFQTIEYALAVAIVLLAGILRGMLGFGATLLAVPVLMTLYGPVEAVVVASIIEIPAIISLLPTAVRQADWRFIAPVGLASLLTIPLGAWLLVSIDPDLARRIIATIVIVFAVLLASGWRYKAVPGLGTKFGVGAISGVTGGMANIGGPIVVMFLVAANTNAAGVRAGIMAFFSISGCYRIVVYAIIGIYTLPFAVVAASLSVPYLLGIWSGSKIFPYVSEKFFMRLAIGFVMAAGLAALLR